MVETQKEHDVARSHSLGEDLELNQERSLHCVTGPVARTPSEAH